MTYTISLWAKFKLKRAKLRITEKRAIQFHLVEQQKIMHYRAIMIAIQEKKRLRNKLFQSIMGRNREDM